MIRPLVILLFFLSGSCFADSDSRSVYEITPVRDWMITGIAVAGILVPTCYASQWINRRCPCNPNEVNGFDRNAIGNNSDTALALANVTVGVSLLAPIALDYWDLGFSREFYEDMVVYTQALAISGALVSITKVIAQRPEPRLYSGQENPAVAGYYDSFYSGHATMTVTALSAAAVTMSLRHKWKVWPWILTGVVGTAISMELVLAGVHFPSDVLVGSAIGVGVGTLVPLLHKRNMNTASDSSVSFAPLPGGAKVLFTRRL